MKTIFVIISKGLLVRNILRTSLLRRLSADKNNQIIIIFPESTRGVGIPDYIRSEFETGNVKIELAKHKVLRRWERLFNMFIFKLVFSKSTRLYLQYHINEKKRTGKISYFLQWLVFSPLSKIKWLKKMIRKIDLLVFGDDNYKDIFDKYNPDLVFSTSIITHFDIEFLKEAKRRNIKTISMPRSWDNLDKFLFRVEPDFLLVQNPVMKREAVRFQALQENTVEVVGFPQFDLYRDPTIFLSKEEYCLKKGFDPALPILFLGSEGPWSKGDDKIFRGVVDSRGKEIPDCNVLVRPHFGSLKDYNYNEVFVGCQNVFIDDKFTKSDFFMDNWDPSWEDMSDFANSLHHCNMMVTFASTLALDTACFDKPIIAINYGVRFKKGKDITNIMYSTCHYDWVLDTKAVKLVDTQSELLQQIDFYLQHPEHKHSERKLLLKDLCYKVDGKSAERIANFILDELNK